ncbi:MAG: DUF1848 domain-containing protein [Muribaculaceae bacterium]|nr:DUF1848 domain-containing protein [Muribaculaceae bacterium]
MSRATDIPAFYADWFFNLLINSVLPTTECIDDELNTRIGWQDVKLMNHLGMKVNTLVPTLFGDLEMLT